MKTHSPVQQRVAILDPEHRSRENARRAVRAMGHSPHVFASLDEMTEVDAEARPYAMVYVGSGLGGESLAQLVEGVRDSLGDAVPLLLALKSASARRSARALAAQQVMPLQSSFTEVYLALLNFMWAHGPNPQRAVLNWGALRFLPACSTVQVGNDTPLMLSTFHFELALELFHNVGRTLSPAWLNAMLVNSAEPLPSAVLEQGVAHLQQWLAQQTPPAWQVHRGEGGAVRLEALASPAMAYASVGAGAASAAAKLRARPSMFAALERRTPHAM